MRKTKIMEDLKEEFNKLPDFLKRKTIKSSNSLIIFPYELSLMEKRIFAYAISSLEEQDRNKTEEELLKTTFTIRVKDFMKLFKINQEGGKIYKELKAASLSLAHRKTIIEKSIHWDEQIFNWVQHVKYKKDIGIIEIKFSEDVAKQLLVTKEKGNFVFYNTFLSHGVLKSKHSIRLFEILQVNKRKNSWYSHFAEFKQLLGLPQSYDTPAAVRRVLEKSKKELNEKLDLGFDYYISKRNKAKNGNYEVVIWAKRNNNDLMNFLLEDDKDKHKKEEKINKIIAEVEESYEVKKNTNKIIPEKHEEDFF